MQEGNVFTSVSHSVQRRGLGFSGPRSLRGRGGVIQGWSRHPEVLEKYLRIDIPGKVGIPLLAFVVI